MKRKCKKCFKILDITCFSSVKGKYNRHVCKECRKPYNRAHYHRNAKKICNKRKEYRKTIKGKNNSKNNLLKYDYGITLQDYNNMLSKQNNVCAICYKKETTKGKSLCVDHNHKTGKIRGLLCFKCNVVLGFCNDNIRIFSNIIKYIKER